MKEMWKSPNGTIRAILDGTVFRAPILVKGIVPYVKNWTKPITIARHAYGDVYKNTEIKVPGKGTAELVFTAEDGTQTKEVIHNFDGPGIIQGIHNTENRTCGSLLKIPFPKNTTIHLRTFSRKFMIRNIKKNSRNLALSISIRLLMMQLPA